MADMAPAHRMLSWRRWAPSACFKAFHERPRAPERIGVSSRRYDSTESTSVRPNRKPSSARSFIETSSCGRVSMNTGQCQR